MEKYTSKYKGAEIDAALDLANSALQPGSLTNYALKSQITELQQSINNKADLNGSAPDLIAGAALSILRTRTSEDIEYSNEYIPAARMLVHAPDCTDRFGSELHVDDSFYPVIKLIAGGVVGGNQMCGLASYEMTTNNILLKSNVNSVKVQGIANAENNKQIMLQTDIPKEHFVLFMCDKNLEQYGSSLAFSLFGRNDWLSGGFPVLLNKTNAAIKSTMKVLGRLNIMYKAGFEIDDTLTFVILDLTTAFPTDRSFVNSLDQNDAPKVLHRLGISSFTINP